MNNAVDRITISREDFYRFREFFYRKTGIWFDDTKRYFVDKRLVERIVATNSDNFRNYFVMLRFQKSGEELQELINSMTVNETYFFREEYQLKCMINSILPEIVKEKRDSSPIRIWSIPSSSGEEPYSIAIYLLEYWTGIDQWDVEIISSDIDTNILMSAQRGVYSQRSVQHLPPHILAKYFKSTDEGYEICDDLKDVVEFTRVNLIDPLETRSYRNFDIIFCRNLLIYFDERSRRIAAENLYDAMKAGGYILLGHTESISRISSLFKVCKFPEAIVYKKPLSNRRELHEKHFGHR